MPKEAKKIEKCAGPKGPFCWVLTDRMQPLPTGRGGRVMVDSPLSEIITLAGVGGVWFKRGARDQAFILNFCPWCGTNIGKRS